MPVRVAEHAARAGYGVELFRITGEKDLRATHFCEPGYPLQVSAVDHAGLVHDDQLVGFDRVRRVRDMVGSDVDAGEQSFQRVGRVPQLLLESAFLLDLGFDPFGIVEGHQHGDGLAVAADAVA